MQEMILGDESEEGKKCLSTVKEVNERMRGKGTTNSNGPSLIRTLSLKLDTSIRVQNISRLYEVWNIALGYQCVFPQGVYV